MIQTEQDIKVLIEKAVADAIAPVRTKIEEYIERHKQNEPQPKQDEPQAPDFEAMKQRLQAKGLLPKD